MLKRLITFILIVLPGLLLAQKDAQYKLLHELGWEAKNFSQPENLSVTDIGETKYLITLTKKGKVSDIKILSNSFHKKTEKKWRRSVKKLILTRQDWKQENIVYKGIFHISRMQCSDDDF